jgi:hypothetical protein
MLRKIRKLITSVTWNTFHYSYETKNHFFSWGTHFSTLFFISDYSNRISRIFFKANTSNAILKFWIQFQNIWCDISNAFIKKCNFWKRFPLKLYSWRIEDIMSFLFFKWKRVNYFRFHLHFLPLSLRSRAELDLNFITITITKAMITKANTIAISTANTGLKLNCHTFPYKILEKYKIRK